MPILRMQWMFTTLQLRKYYIVCNPKNTHYACTEYFLFNGMGKKDDLINELIPILNDKDRLEKFIIKNSNLPGPRGNLELAFALADIYENFDVLIEWTRISEDQADVNNPKSFLAFCAVVCLGSIYSKRKNEKIIAILKQLANDGRWRMKEAVAFGFQLIGEHDFGELKKIFSDWIIDSNNLEKRAVLVSLAHPPLLNKANTEFCFEMVETVLKEMDRENDFDVLRKGLEFTISVFVAANPKMGFSFIKRWIGKDKVIDKIMKENLKKNRLFKINPEEVMSLLSRIE